MNQNPPGVDGIDVRRAGSELPITSPDWFDITPESFGADRAAITGRVRIGVPSGWRVEQRSPLHWRVHVGEVDLDRWVCLRLAIWDRGHTTHLWQRCLPVRLWVRSTFDIDRHTFPMRNSSRVLGDVRGSQAAFRETYRGMPARVGSLLFHGLYRDIVYIGGSGEHRGGLCSGMARWAGLRALHDDDADVPMVAALREITKLHGRQLLDRALLESAIWFLRGSSRSAYRVVRDDMLRTGRSTSALDLRIPIPWRRDVLTSLVGDGHTVVPYEIEQFDPDTAIVTVYDPNRGREPQEMRFDLRRDRYAFRHMVSLDDSKYGLIAIRHVAYATPGTAYLAAIGSMFWRFLRDKRDSK
ncbi:MAG: hypothetical protein ACOC9Y_10495 [Chloroflexota bacterium]